MMIQLQIGGAAAAVVVEAAGGEGEKVLIKMLHPRTAIRCRVPVHLTMTTKTIMRWKRFVMSNAADQETDAETRMIRTRVERTGEVAEGEQRTLIHLRRDPTEAGKTETPRIPESLEESEQPSLPGLTPLIC